MNLNTIKYFCTTNGKGARTAIFVSGCNNHCPGCFNKIAWDFNLGTELTDEVIQKDILEPTEPVYIKGISLLGGEPMDERNQEGIARIIKAFREKFGDSKDIWMWSGYYMENIPETEHKSYILSEVNWLIDGPFDASQYDKDLQYMGSANQHLIKLKEPA